MTNWLVSVIVPAYNAEAFIYSTLNSILLQSYKNIEVIVVDDGSQDKTVEIVKSVAAKDNRVMLLRQSNQGVATARNLAIENSKGEYIAPCDADDIWYPQKIEKQMRCIATSSSLVGLVYTWIELIDEKGSHLKFGRKWDIKGDVLAPLLCSNFIGGGSTPLIRRKCIDHVGGYNCNFIKDNAQGCEDRDLYLRIAEHYAFSVVKSYLVGYRKSRNSMSMNRESMFRSSQLVFKDFIRRGNFVPDNIYKFRKSYIFLEKGIINSKSGNYKMAINYIYNAILLNRILLLHPATLKIVVIFILKNRSKKRVLPIKMRTRRKETPLLRSPLLRSMIWLPHSWLRFRKLHNIKSHFDRDITGNMM